MANCLCNGIRKTTPPGSAYLKRYTENDCTTGRIRRAKHDGDPGPIVMWKGLRSLYAYIRAREVFTRAFGHTHG